MKPINLLYFAVAMFFPIILAVAITDNTNETHPIWYWFLCPILYFIAGYLSVPGVVFQNGKIGGKFKWMVLAVFIGLAEAAILIWSA